jgi:predicted ATPase/Tfp pilus assembly protein PilF
MFTGTMSSTMSEIEAHTSNGPSLAPVIRAFISYSHDSPEHKARALSLANRLRNHGIVCQIDSFNDLPPPTEGWPEWMIRQIERADFVLVVCTETYHRRFRRMETPGTGLGAQWEGAVITQEIYEASSHNGKFVPIGFQPYAAAHPHIPIVLKGTNYYDVSDEDGYERLYRHLTNQPLTPPGPVSPGLTVFEPGWQPRRISLPSPMVTDYSEPANEYVERPGVEREITAALAAGMREPGPIQRSPRLVTLHGDGGMGMTRLANRCRQAIATNFPGGTWFVHLASVRRDRAAVADAIAGTFDLRATAEADVIRFVNGKPPLLLLLDNVETVRCDPVRDLISTLLAASPELRILATGRWPLGLHGEEKVISVNDGLTLAEATTLFRARASLRKPPPLPNDADLRRLLNMTCGIPLAIEHLAAWWFGYTTIEEMIADYERPFSDMPDLTAPPDASASADDPTASERQRSLMHSLHWSWRKLGAQPGGAEAQRTFAAAGLFAEGSSFSLEGLCALLDTPERGMRSHVAKVQDASLIRMLASELPSNYSMHRFNRAYARVRLREQIDAREIVSAFIEFYVALSYTAGRNTENNGNRAVMGRELRNIMEAQREAADREDWNSVVALCMNCANYLDDSGLLSDWEAVSQAALRAAQSAGNSTWAGDALNCLGYVYRLTGRLSDAETTHRTALSAFASAGLRLGEVRALSGLALVYQSQNRLKDASEILKQCVEISRSIGDQRAVATTLCNLGGAYERSGKLAEAKQAIEEALTIFYELDDDYGAACATNNLGNIHHSRRDFAQAEIEYLRSLAMKRSRGDRRGEGNSLRNLSTLYLDQSRPLDAERAAKDAIVILRDTGPRDIEARTLHVLGQSYFQQGQWPEARAAFEQASSVFEELGDRDNEVKARTDIARAYQSQGDIYQSTGSVPDAENAYASAHSIYCDVNDRVAATDVLVRSAAMYHARGLWQKAEGA